ncbi:MAG: Holliday junction resolvase RecU [Defluviitaleaceae bacterium]|nr:Holliday junction resolvase RecU [Defluviitaleaceae bacterium]
MAYWNTRGLRGSSFEEMINLTNQLYLQQKLAVIQKIPTPITPIEVNNHERIITKAYFGEKSTVDYIGVVQGIAVCFDAKETQYKNLPLKNIHSHQIAFMDDFMQQDGIAFLLVHFKTMAEMFFLPAEQLKRHYELSQQGKRKSIPYSEFDQDYKIRNTASFPVHYLEALNTYLMK